VNDTAKDPSDLFLNQQYMKRMLISTKARLRIHETTNVWNFTRIQQRINEANDDRQISKDPKLKEKEECPFAGLDKRSFVYIRHSARCSRCSPCAEMTFTPRPARLPPLKIESKSQQLKSARRISAPSKPAARLNGARKELPNADNKEKPKSTRTLKHGKKEKNVDKLKCESADGDQNVDRGKQDDNGGGTWV